MGFLLFFQVLPKGMKFEDNIAVNKVHYIAYCDLENKLMTYLTTKEAIVDFTTNIDDQLKNYHAISFDLQQVPFSEVQKQFQELKNTSNKENNTSTTKVIETKTYVPVPVENVKKTAEEVVEKNDTLP
jgi:hypothetical protein